MKEEHLKMAMSNLLFRLHRERLKTLLSRQIDSFGLRDSDAALEAIFLLAKWN
jgi:hypothetical protein